MTDLSSLAITDTPTLTGDEYIPILDANGNFVKAKLGVVTPHADHRKPRPFKGRVPIYPVSDVLDVMSAASGVGSTYTLTAASGGSATRAASNSAYYGTQLVTLVTGNGGPGVYSLVRRNDIGRTINVSGKWMGIDVSSPDPTKIYNIAVFVGNSNLTNYYRWNNILGSQSTRPMQANGRTRLVFPMAISSLGSLGYASSATGSPNLTTVTSWQIRIDDAGTGAATLNIDRVFFFDPPPATVSVTADDGYSAWYTLGKPVMDEYGIRSTIFAIRAYHDSSQAGFSQDSNRLTEDMIARFVDGGHELGFHMTGNNAGQDFSPAAVDAECVAFKKWARNKFGVDVMSAAYPGGENGYYTYTGQSGWVSGDETKTIRDSFAKHFPFVRTINRVSPESDPPADNSLLKCFMYQYGTGASQTTTTLNAGYVDTVIGNGGVAIASYHNLVSGTPQTGVTTEYNIDDFTTNMQYLRSHRSSLAILPIREAFTRTL